MNQKFKIGDKVFIISNTIYDLFCNPHIDNNLYYANDCVKIDEKKLKKSILECLDLNVSLYSYLIINNFLEDNFDHYVFEIYDIKEKSIIVEKKELKLFIEIDNSCLDCIYFAEEMFNIINLAFKYDLKNHYLISNKTREIKTLLLDIYNIIALSDSKNPEEYRESLLIMERALRDLGYRL